MGSKMNTREKILTTAAFLFQKNGYHATGLNEIIKESGTPKGSLYYYFPVVLPVQSHFYLSMI